MTKDKVSGKTDFEFSPEQVKTLNEASDSHINAMIEILSQWVSQLDALRVSSDKANSQFIAYMDRIILLAGGTLTLIFTVLGNLSVHLRQGGLQATSPHLILTTCWLLVAAILSSLVFNVVSINLQQRSDVVHGLRITDTKMKLSLLVASRNLDATKIPALIDPESATKRLDLMRRMRFIAGVAVQTCIVASFVSLAIFIQRNLPILLNIPH